MVFGLLRSPFRVVHSALNQKRLVVVEGDALDDAGEFLGGGFAFWDCGRSIGDSFSHGRSALGDAISRAIPVGDLPARRGLRPAPAYQRCWQPLWPV
jgi:hypothetical protein